MDLANSTKRTSPYTLASSIWVKHTVKARIYSPMDHTIGAYLKITLLKGHLANTNQKIWNIKAISKAINSIRRAKRKESAILTKGSITKEIKLMEN